MKKKKKKRGLGRALARTSQSCEQSPLRPKHVEKKPPCRDACPSGNHIREFVTTIAQAERLGKSPEQALEESWYIYTDTSPFPAVCGRVCPAPCEKECNRKELEGPVNINNIERAIGDFGIDTGLKLRKLAERKMSQNLAVVGAGPSGLSCAYQLARRGYRVTLYRFKLENCTGCKKCAEECPSGFIEMH